MTSVLLGNPKLSLPSATLPAPRPAPPVQLALSPSDTRGMNMKKPPALSLLTTLVATVIRFEIEVPRRPMCRCVGLSLFGKTAGLMHNRLLLQVVLYLLTRVVREISFIYCTEVKIIEQKPDQSGLWEQLSQQLRRGPRGSCPLTMLPWLNACTSRHGRKLVWYSPGKKIHLLMERGCNKF